MTTKHAFIAAYRKRVVETYGEGTPDPWAADPERLERFMQSVTMTVMTKATTWAWDSPLSRQAWRDIGCKGKITLKGIKALPEAPAPIDKAKALELIKELREYDHLFLTREGALNFSKPFGFEARTWVHKADPTDPKGLTFHDGRKQAEGIDAAVLAGQICSHLGVKARSMFGRGSQLRSCCDALEAHFAK